MMNKKSIRTMIEMYGGGRVGLGILSVNIAEDRERSKICTNPTSSRKDLSFRTRSGRVATTKAYEHLGYEHKQK